MLPSVSHLFVLEELFFLWVSLVALGLCLLDNAHLEQLAEACHQRERYAFMLNMGPLRLRHVTGSPVNPIALF
jgi:hypothetical protein